jgi:hypothetical protein
MPPPRKVDLLPEQLRDWLREELGARGFADIVEITEALNFRLEERGEELRIGKTAVGEYSKLLKDQQQAFRLAETLLGQMDVEAESDMHRTAMHMIVTMSMQLMQSVRAEDEHLPAKDLMSLGRMLKDVMGSAQAREKMLADERARVSREAREAAAAEVERGSNELGLSAKTVEQIKSRILGVSA